MSRAGITKLPLKSSAQAPVPVWKLATSVVPTIAIGSTHSRSHCPTRRAPTASPCARTDGRPSTALIRPASIRTGHAAIPPGREDAPDGLRLQQPPVVADDARPVRRLAALGHESETLSA